VTETGKTLRNTEKSGHLVIKAGSLSWRRMTFY
jgi:hypothetical protein